MVSLDRLLDRNYDKVDPEDREEYYFRSMEFIKNNPSIADQSIDFSKRITKAALRMLENKMDFIEDYLERVYRYNIQGIENIERSELESTNFQIMKSHFHAHAGTMARELYEKTKDLKWKEFEYINCLESKLISSQICSDKEHSYFVASITSEAALDLVEKDKNLEPEDFVHLLKRAYHLGLYSGENLEELKPKDACVPYLQSCIAAKKLYHYTENIEWAENAYETEKIMAELDNYFNRKKDERERFSSLFSFAKQVFEKTNLIEWAEKAYKAKEKQIELNNQDKYKVKTYDCLIAFTKEVHEKTKDVRWAERVYNLLLTSSNLSITFDKNQAMWSYAKAAEVSKELFLETKDVRWAERSYHAKKEELKLVEYENSKLEIYKQLEGLTKKIFETTKDLSWLENYYEAISNYAELNKKLNPSKASRNYSDVADICSELYEKTKQIKFLDARCRALSESMKSAPENQITFLISSSLRILDTIKKYILIDKQIKTKDEEKIFWLKKSSKVEEKLLLMQEQIGEKKSAAYSCIGVSESLEELYDLTNDISYCRKRYDILLKSMDLSKNLDEKHYAHCASFAGRMAKIMFFETNEMELADESVKLFNIFLTYYKKNPNKGRSGLIKYIEHQLKEIQPYSGDWRKYLTE